MVNEQGLSHVDFMNYGSFVSDDIFSYLGETKLNNREYVNKIYEKIDETNRKFAGSLKEYVESYINYLLNPSSTYWVTYQTNQSTAVFNKDNLTKISYSIQSDTAKLASQTSEKKNRINNEEKTYKSLLKKINNINSVDNSSALLIDESTELYKSQYIDNSILIFGIIVLLVVLYKLYK
jgi:hypothetical protein